MNPAKQQIGSLQAEAEIGGPKHEIVCTQQSWVLGMPALHILLIPFATNVNPIHLAVTFVIYNTTGWQRLYQLS